MQSGSHSGASTARSWRPEPRDGHARKIRAIGDRLEVLADSGFKLDGGRCLGPMWWCMIRTPDGHVVLKHGWTYIDAGRSAVSELRRLGWELDAKSGDAITEGIRHQIFGQ